LIEMGVDTTLAVRFVTPVFTAFGYKQEIWGGRFAKAIMTLIGGRMHPIDCYINIIDNY
jgi:hypothetical protein